MGTARLILSTVTATLLAIVLASLAARMPRSRSRGEEAWLAALSALVLLAAFLDEPPPAAMTVSLAALWAGSMFLARAAGAVRLAGWHAALLAPLLGVAAGAAAGHGSSLPLRAFHAFSVVLLAISALPALARVQRARRTVSLPAAAAAAALWACAGAARAIAALGAAAALPGPAAADRAVLLDAAMAAAIVLVAGSLASLVLLEGSRFWRGGLHGTAAEEISRGRLLASVYTRLLEAENALAVQDALIASGLLALGAAHEFKRSLSLLTAAAEYGFAAGETGEKQESLRLVLAQAREGTGAAVAFLERLAHMGRERERVVDARKDLAGLVRVARASARAGGILVVERLEPGVFFRARPTEIGQVLVNLIDNAVQALQGPGPRTALRIEVSARREEGKAVLDVRDTAGGVQPETAARLFEPGSSSTGSTGLGLYVGRSLAERNGGTLSWLPVEGGSCFRAAFPLAAGEDRATEVPSADGSQDSLA